MPDRKYTDEDVRADDSLRTLALAYVKTYQGEFPPLARLEYLVRTDQLVGLTVSQARMVLNCMLHDANVINLPTPTGKVFNAAEHYSPTGRISREHRPRIQTVRPLPSVIPLRSSWKDPFLYSSWQTAKLIHVIRNKDKHSSWMPVNYMRDQHELQYRLWVECATHVPKDYATFASHARANELVIHAGKKLCKECAQYTSKWQAHEVSGLIIPKEEA